MKRIATSFLLFFFLEAAIAGNPALGYVAQSTIPLAGGCPQLDRWNLSVSSPLNRRWSTSLSPMNTTVLTAAAAGSAAQLTEIQQVISDSFGAWAGATGTTFNSTAFPGLISPLASTSVANSCTNDAESTIDGLNTICFNQASMGFTSGVLAFTRTITANAAGVSVGSSATSAFAGQILDTDSLFRNDGQAVFATPAALTTPQGAGTYDLETLLAHELGHWFGLDHSGVWRALMFPFAPPPGQFLGNRPTPQSPDGVLSDDDRTGIRMLYPDPNDALNVGTIRGRVLPANPFALAIIPSPSTGRSVTGMFGVQVVAVDADTGAVIAATLGGWSCNPSNPPVQFDGTYELDRLPVGHTYNINAEPLIGLVGPGDFNEALEDLCVSGGTTECTTPAANTNFNVRTRPTGP
jgi:Matrixin